MWKQNFKYFLKNFLLCICNLFCHSFLLLISFNYYRIDRITFDFTLSTFFRERIIEDDASVHAIFQIHITLVNDLYSSMAVSINLDTQLSRYCGSFKIGTTILDVMIIVLIILSMMTYFVSLVGSFKLAWVCTYVRVIRN